MKKGVSTKNQEESLKQINRFFTARWGVIFARWGVLLKEFLLSFLNSVGVYYYHMCQGLNSHYFHIIGDGHQPNSRGLYTHYKDSLLKVGGLPSPIKRNF